jgi:glycosyltransferase involved in cell wall biosynthesis
MMAGRTFSLERNSLRVAIVHEWFVDYSGSERLVEQMLNLFPQADLFAQVEFLPEDLKGFIKNKPVATSFIQKLPRARTRYRTYLPLMPLAVEQFDMSAYDLVLSNNHAVSKGVITGPDQVHICCCCSPMRYAWELTHQYLRGAGMHRGLKGWITKAVLHYMRQWDYRSANGVDQFVAISDFIARRIRKVYRREAHVIYPPVDVEGFELCTHKEDFYFTASRMVPYKRIDLIVEAFSRMPDRRLVVIGDGPEFAKIRVLAGPNIEFLGFQTFEVLRDYMQRARAFVFAAEEDFGIIPVEAQACGTPVIAFGKGGALETVVDNETGLFFDDQTVDAVIDSVERFEQMVHFSPAAIRRHSLRFSPENFRTEFNALIERTMEAHYRRIEQARRAGSPVADTFPGQS